jgi:Fe-S cluster assembly scaffold protein SufB
LDNHFKEQFFIGSWNLFCVQFPDAASTYVSEPLNPFIESSFSSISLAQTMVLYVPSYYEGNIDFSHFPQLFSHEILKIIIIVDIQARVVFKENALSCLPEKQIMHIILNAGAYCVYEHDFSGLDQELCVRATLVTLYDSAVCNYYALYAGNASLVHHYDSFIRGAFAQSVLRGVYCATQKQRIVLTSFSRHLAPQSESTVLIKGVIADHAHVSYKGSVHIATQAHTSRASQENGTLVVGDCASVESVPTLEVLNNEVQCSHASAVGRLDEKQILYLQSRGIPLIDAQRLILKSYVENVFAESYNDMHLQKKVGLLVNSLMMI